MTKIYATLFLSIFFFLNGRSQKTGVILGNVKDKNTQEIIIGATIFIEGTTNGAITDTDGNFKISIPVGTYRLKSSFIGYTPPTQHASAP
jgi:hypothetical protein